MTLAPCYLTLLRFQDLAGADAAGAHISARDCPVEIDLDALQVGQKTPETFSDDLGAGTAGPFDLTTPFIFGTRRRAFMADDAFFGHFFFLCFSFLAFCTKEGYDYTEKQFLVNPFLLTDDDSVT